MIDRPDQAGRLLEQMSAAFPIPARVTPELQALLREQNGGTIPAACSATWVGYAGDEGGVCKLDADIDKRRVHLPYAPASPPALVSHLVLQPEFT